MNSCSGTGSCCWMRFPNEFCTSVCPSVGSVHEGLPCMLALSVSLRVITQCMGVE